MGRPEKLDDCELDRLVDGELTPGQRRRLLTALDGQEDGWRRCALAFLEAQTLRTHLPAIASGNRAGAPTVNRAAEQSLSPANFAARPSARQARGALRSAGGWLAVGAAVMVAFALGQLLGDAHRTPDDGRPLADAGEEDRWAAGPEQSPPAALPKQDGDAAEPDVVTLVVQDADGAARRLHLPLFESGDLDQRLGGAPGWSPPEGLVAQLRERGLELQTRRRYAPVFFERRDGLVPMVVPVDDAYVRPVSRRIY